MPVSLLGSPRRLLLVSGLAALLGIVGGGCGAVLLRLIGLITNVALSDRLESDIPSSPD